MKKHVALTVLLLTTLGVLNAHVDLPVVDGRRFLQVQGRLHDPTGWLEDQWTALSRSCGRVQSLDAGGERYRQSVQAVRAFSPPDSASARLHQLLHYGDWLLGEVEFEQLSPAVVVLAIEGETIRVVERAIWSGDTRPWRPAPLIRRHLLEQAPVPTTLVECFTPLNPLFQPTATKVQ